jgi:hypothetical protein
MFDHTGPEKIASDKHSSILGSLISYEENKVLILQPLGSYSQNFIFFITYKWAQLAREFLYTRLEMLPNDCLLGPFVSYRENEMLQIRSQGLF